jgi:hypothetical protein
LYVLFATGHFENFPTALRRVPQCQLTKPFDTSPEMVVEHLAGKKRKIVFITFIQKML